MVLLALLQLYTIVIILALHIVHFSNAENIASFY